MGHTRGADVNVLTQVTYVQLWFTFCIF